jgi:hypothetical protein
MTTSGFDQDYRSVELTYSQGRFTEALQEGLTLLEGTALVASDPQILRLQLLLGHIHFYGLHQPLAAGALYRQVRDAASDGSTFSDLAGEGLALCQQSAAGLDPAPPDSGLDEGRVEVLEELHSSGRDGEGLSRFSPEEEAELAKGRLRVVLG